MIRKFQAEDTDAIISVWHAASLIATPFLDADFLAKEAENIRNIYIPNTESWVFEEEGSVKGFISMMGNEVGAIFVLPEMQGKGIGRQLMNAVAEIHSDLEVEVFKRNEIGGKFYDKYGFRFVKAYRHEPTGEQMVRLKFVGAIAGL